MKYELIKRYNFEMRCELFLKTQLFVRKSIWTSARPKIGFEHPCCAEILVFLFTHRVLLTFGYVGFKLQHSTLSNSGTTITNSAPNGFGSGAANQHWVLHVISQLNFYFNFGIFIHKKTRNLSFFHFSIAEQENWAY